jgi:hypothetical protein
VIWHPLVWAFWAAAVTGGVLFAAGAAGALDVVANWAPEQTGNDQLRRERWAETAALLGHWSLGCLTAAATMGLFGVAVIWHRSVPGAMCGTGVLQAMGEGGRRAMLFWAASLIILYGWRVLDRLDSHHPQGLLIPAGARLMITAAPFLTLALFYSWQALMRIDTAPPVSCCAAVYDQVLNAASDRTFKKWLTTSASWFSIMGGIALPAAAILTPRFRNRGAGALIIALAVTWAAGSTIAVKQVWSAYYYQVLSHPCPWCLFLPDYHGAGYLIFGCLAVAVMESTALSIAHRTRDRHPVLAGAAERRCRQAAWRILASVVAFMLLTVGPAIAWRLRTGFWIDGSS